MTTHIETPKVLLIGNDPAVSEAIRAASIGSFDVEWVRQLSEGLLRLSTNGIAAILLELSLPDSDHIEAFDKLSAKAPDVPILILGGYPHEPLAGRKAQEAKEAEEKVARGAQDYLQLDHLDGYTLTRALRHAIGRKAVEDALFVEKERALVTLNSIGDAVLSTDISGNITYLNFVAETMTGWSRNEAIGKPLAEVFRIIDGGTRKAARDPMEMAIEQNRTVGLTMNCVLIRRDGFESAIEDSAAPIHDRGGRIIGAVIVFHDVSAARAMAHQMSHSAQHDVVTNLPHRMLLNDRLKQAISLARRHGHRIAVLFLDLDRFKHINDSLGHVIGDQLLQAVAMRLKACVRRSDTVGRQGGDEFVLILSELDVPENAAGSAAKLLTALNVPYHISLHDLHVPVSIGVSIYPDDAADAETLINNADTAMYQAKENGRNTFQFFKQEMIVRAVERQFIEGSLRVALERKEFSLHYQPKIDLCSDTIVGV